jgi:hypothetical protein
LTPDINYCAFSRDGLYFHTVIPGRDILGDLDIWEKCHRCGMVDPTTIKVVRKTRLIVRYRSRPGKNQYHSVDLLGVVSVKRDFKFQHVARFGRLTFGSF